VQIRLALDARKLTDYGIGTYVHNLLRGLAARPEVRLTVLARGGHEPRVADLAPSARVLSVSASGYGVSEHVRLPAALWREHVDIVHIPHYVLPLGLLRPAVVTVHDVIQLFYPPKRRPALAQLYLRLMLRSTLRRARRVITVSRASRRDLVHLFGADAAQLDVVPSGVDQRLVTRPPPEVVDDLKRRYDLRPPLVLVVANDKPHKNLDFVLRAYHAARRQHRVPGQLVLWRSSVSRTGCGSWDASRPRTCTRCTMRPPCCCTCRCTRASDFQSSRRWRPACRSSRRTSARCASSVKERRGW